MRQNPTNNMESHSVVEFLDELLQAFEAELNEILERDPNEFNQGSAELVGILEQVERILTCNRRKFERKLNEVVFPEKAIWSWARRLSLLGEQLQGAEWVGLLNDVDARLQRVCVEIIAWRIMGCANNHTHFSGIQAPTGVRNQKPRLTLLDREES